MTREKILRKAAQELYDRGPDLTLFEDALVGAETVLDAVEDDIRRDERARITDWLRTVAQRHELRFHRSALEAMAAELDRRPIEE